MRDGATINKAARLAVHMGRIKERGRAMNHQPFFDSRSIVEHPQVEGAFTRRWNGECNQWRIDFGKLWRWLAEPARTPGGSHWLLQARMLALLLLLLLPLGIFLPGWTLSSLASRLSLLVSATALILVMIQQREIVERDLPGELTATQQRELAETLRDLTLVLTLQMELPAVLAEIVSQAARLVPYSTANIALLEGDLLRIAHMNGYPDSIKQQLATPERPWDALPLDRKAITTCEPVVVPDTARAAEWQALGQNYWRSYIAVPIVLHGRVLGLLRLNGETPNQFRAQDAQNLIPLANAAAIAIEHARMFAQEEQRSAELALALAQQRELENIRTQVIQNVSHELRTPLAIARGYAELLESGALGELLPQQKEPVSIIVQRTQKLSRMMDDISVILDVETHKVKQEPVNLDGLVHGMLSDLYGTADRMEVKLAVKLAHDLPPILGDASHLQRVVDNLVTNALKFTPSGGTVTLRTGRENGTVSLEVADTGIGIAPEQLAQIFECFYQVDGSTTRRYPGTGLGLTLVKRIVEAHGGQVTVTSTTGEGSVFHVKLPAADRQN